MPYSTDRINPSLWKTIGIWRLLWCFSTAGHCWALQTKTLNAAGERGEQRRSSSCFFAGWAGGDTHPQSARSLQTAFGEKPEAQRRIRPTGPRTPSCKVCLVWSNVRYRKDFSDCRTENAYGSRLLPSVPVRCVSEGDPTHTQLLSLDVPAVLSALNHLPSVSH